MKHHRLVLIALVSAAASLLSDPRLEITSTRAADTVSTQATSSFVLGEQDDAKTVDITNVTFSTTGSHVPGRPEEERLLLRTAIRTREVLDEKGLDATVTVDAWPLGADLTREPLYTVSVDGVRASVMDDNALLVVDRGTEDVDWWSIYALGTGVHFFDTFAHPLWFGSSPPRYVGLDVPPDDAQDERLRDPKVVGVLAYASAERVIRRVLVTCSDPARAALLRSYWDTTRELSFLRFGTLADSGPALSVHLTWRPTGAMTSAPPITVPDTASIPIYNDELDLANAQLPPCIALAPWSP